MSVSGTSCACSAPTRTSEASVAIDAQRRAGHDVGGLARLGPASFVVDGDDAQRAGRPAGVVEVHRVATHQAVHPGAGHRQRRVGGRGRGPRRLLGEQPDARRLGDLAERVAARADLDHRRSGFEGTGAHFRPRQVHDDAARAPVPLFGAAQVLDHAPPLGGPVVRAIDAHAVHTLLQQLRHEGVVVGSLARHRDHDGHAAAGRSWPQHGLGVGIEQPLPAGQVSPWRRGVGRDGGRAGQASKDGKHGFHGGQDMRFGPAEGREARGCEPRLKRPLVAAAQRQIVEQIPGTLLMLRMHVLHEVGGIVDQFQHVATDTLDVIDQAGEIVRREHRLHSASRPH
jgi:hypothetical protein